jgi:hypothetical protein
MSMTYRPRYVALKEPDLVIDAIREVVKSARP